MLELGVKFLISYFIGSLMGAMIVGKLRGGIDIRTMGSGNAGGTNAFRTQGFWFALAVVIIDIGKGALATWMIPLLAIAVCDWLLNAKRDKTYSTLFEMGFVWILSMAGMLGYRSVKSASVSVNLADRVPVGQYMELMFPFFIALGAFFLVMLVVSIKQYKRPALHIVVGSLAITCVMPFYYNALPSYTSLTENRPMPILGQALTDRIAEFSDGNTLVLHRPFFIKTFPDVVYYLKKLDKGGNCVYSLGSNARSGDLVQALATPNIAADLFKKEHPDAEKYPLYQFLKNTKFKNAVLLLSPADYQNVKPFIDSLPSMFKKFIEVEERDMLTIKWIKDKVFIVRFNPGKN